jgi:Na+-transporting NADH:ubiquinone oxidoreductase subunit NqrB
LQIKYIYCGVTTINTRLQMVCTFIDTLCKYTTCIKRNSLMLLVSGWLRWPGDCSWSRLTALLLGRLLRVLLFTLALSLGRAVQWSQRVDPAGSHLSLRRPAPVAGFIATYRTCHVSTRTALIELNVLTGPSRLADWSVFQVWGHVTTDGRSVSQSVCLFIIIFYKTTYK